MKLKLDNEAIAQEFFEDALLLGISAPMKDYIFCWHLNQVLGFDFRVDNNCEIAFTRKDRTGKERTYFFAIFQFTVPSTTITHYLYRNHCDGEYLLPEFKHLDYVWLIKGFGMTDEEVKALMQTIRTIPGVQLVNEMTNEKIRNKQHLIF